MAYISAWEQNADLGYIPMSSTPPPVPPAKVVAHQIFAPTYGGGQADKDCYAKGGRKTLRDLTLVESADIAVRVFFFLEVDV